MKAETENAARAIEEGPLPSLAVRREGAAKALWVTLHSPRTHDRDRIQAARVILQETAREFDPVAEFRRRLGTPQAALEWAEAFAEAMRREIAAGAQDTGQPSRLPVVPFDGGDAGEPERRGP
jgi:hypothetical protein